MMRVYIYIYLPSIRHFTWERWLHLHDIFPGEMRTVAGNGTEPVRNVDEWEELKRGEGLERR